MAQEQPESGTRLSAVQTEKEVGKDGKDGKVEEKKEDLGVW
jgi:hypothetical protein